VFATTPLEAVKELDDALERGDLEAVLNFYEDDAVVVVVVEPNRLARGKKDLREFFTFIYAHSQCSSDKDSCNRVKRYRLFISKWVFSGFDVNGQPFSREAIATCVLRKNADEKWRLVIDNSLGPAILETTDA
jgi:ketosteroid isomerase-like protein